MPIPILIIRRYQTTYRMLAIILSTLHRLQVNWKLFTAKMIFTMVLFAVLGAGCRSSPPETVLSDIPKTPALVGPDYRDQGHLHYTRFDETLISATGCEVEYTYLGPKKRSNAVVIAIGHGFMRSKARMDHLAGHLAGWGLSVANIEFCNSRLWVGNHDLNGADMVAVTRQLNADRVIYTGFSAGGLAALVATELDDRSIAYFGLDAVDNQGLGKQIAPELRVPVYGLSAVPSFCNAHNNGLDLFAVAVHSKVVAVADSSHCHFEFPVDGKCAFVCGRGEKHFSRSVIQQTILGLTTAFMVWQTGIDPNGQTWWSDHQPNHQMLVEAGLIYRLVRAE